MVDNVNISGVDFGGNIPLWATESTLGQVVNLLRDISNDNTVTQNAINQVRTAIVSNTQGGQNTNQALLNAINSLSNNTRQQAAPQANTRPAPAQPATVNTNDGLFGILTASVGFVSKQIAEATYSIARLTNMGIDLSMGVEKSAHAATTLGNIVGDANISVSEIIGLMGNFGTAINQYGIQRFSRLSASLSKTDGALSQMGLTAYETAEVTAQYIEQQRILGSLRSLDEQNFSRNIAKSMKSIEEWSVTLGKSKQELLANQTALLAETNITDFLNNVPEDLKMARKAIFESISNEIGGVDTSFASQIANALTQVVVGNTELHGDLISAGANEAAAALLKWSEAAKSGDIEAAAKMQSRFVKELSTIDTTQAKNIMSSSFLEMANTARRVADLQKGTIPDSQQASRMLAIQLDTLYRELSNTVSEISLKVLGGGVLETATTALTSFTKRITAWLEKSKSFLVEKIPAYLDKAADFFTKEGENSKTGFEMFIENLKESINGLSSLFKAFKIIADSISSLVTGEVDFSTAMSNIFGDAASHIADGISDMLAQILRKALKDVPLIGRFLKDDKEEHDKFLARMEENKGKSPYDINKSIFKFSNQQSVSDIVGALSETRQTDSVAAVSSRTEDLNRLPPPESSITAKKEYSVATPTRIEGDPEKKLQKNSNDKYIQREIDFKTKKLEELLSQQVTLSYEMLKYTKINNGGK